MASMEDLIATISGGMHAGQKGNDLKDLHAKLAQTLQPTLPTYRPIPPPPPPSVPHSTAGPLPPPAPASSWNDALSPPSSANANPAMWAGLGNSPRQQGIIGSQGAKRDVGFSVPMPKNGKASGGEERPYHANVLPQPQRAEVLEKDGFEGDAFRPLWQGGQKEDRGGQAGGVGWGGFQGERRG